MPRRRARAAATCEFSVAIRGSAEFGPVQVFARNRAQLGGITHQELRYRQVYVNVLFSVREMLLFDNDQQDQPQ